jgi:uncharacterized membrane protein
VSLEPYVWLKWLHVLSGAVLLGTALGTAFQFWSAHRTRKVRVVTLVARAAGRADRQILLPAMIALLVTGLGLVIVTRTPIDMTWLLASYGLLLVALGCWWMAAALLGQMRALAQESVDSGAPVRYAYHEAAKRWFVLIWPAFAAVVLVFLLMTARPPFW